MQRAGMARAARVSCVSVRVDIAARASGMRAEARRCRREHCECRGAIRQRLMSTCFVAHECASAARLCKEERGARAAMREQQAQRQARAAVSRRLCTADCR